MLTKKWQVGRHVCRMRRWDDLQNEIEGYINLLGPNDDDRFIVIRWRNNHRFVQFASLNETMTGEAVGNHSLNEGERLTPATCGQLTQPGWRER